MFQNGSHKTKHIVRAFHWHSLNNTKLLYMYVVSDNNQRNYTFMSVNYSVSGSEEINILFNKNQTSFGAELWIFIVVWKFTVVCLHIARCKDKVGLCITWWQLFVSTRWGDFDQQLWDTIVGKTLWALYTKYKMSFGAVYLWLVCPE